MWEEGAPFSILREYLRITCVREGDVWDSLQGNFGDGDYCGCEKVEGCDEYWEGVQG